MIPSPPMGRININERTLLTRYFVFLFLFIYIMNTAFAVFKCKGKDNCCLSIDQTLVLILKFSHFSPSSETFILSYLKYPLLFLIQHFASWKFTSLLEKIKKRKEKKSQNYTTQKAEGGSRPRKSIIIHLECTGSGIHSEVPRRKRAA